MPASQNSTTFLKTFFLGHPVAEMYLLKLSYYTATENSIDGGMREMIKVTYLISCEAFDKKSSAIVNKLSDSTANYLLVFNLFRS